MAAAGVMAVNSDARLWSPFKALYDVVDAAVFKKQADGASDLEIALRKHKPDFISLLRNPPKSSIARGLVTNSDKQGIPVHGEQRTQTFSPEFIAEALILSDLFEMNECAAVELLMAGENQQPNFPGLSRGLVSVLLFYDGRRSLVNSLRALLQAREGHTWTLGLSSELVDLATKFTDQLVAEGLINKILDLQSNMDLTKELDKLQKDRALGPSKHRKQVTDIYKEIQLSLAECLFCLACQQPLTKENTRRLIAHLRADNSINADGTLEPVSLCLLMTLLYCFDVSILDREDAEETIRKLPVICDSSYVHDLHQEMMSDQQWTLPGIKAVARFAWSMMLRQISQYPMASGVNEYCEDDETLLDLAIHDNVFDFLHQAVVSITDFHHEEFHLRRLHGLITDFIFHMPLKVKELRNRGDEAARIMLAHVQEGLEPPSSLRRDFEQMLKLIGSLYDKDPLNLELAKEFWCPPEPPTIQDSLAHYRPPQRQVALFKFVRLAGDLLPASLYIPYITMLTGLASSNTCAHHCFSLLKMNGISSGGSASMVSWDHIFASLNQYYSSLRRETASTAELSHTYRMPHLRGITTQELEGLIAVLKLTHRIIDKNENCRVALYENQQWSVVVLLFGLVGCSVPSLLKGQLLRVLSAMAKTPDIAASLWHTLEMSQILTTVQVGSKKQAGGIQVELDEIESRQEEYPMTQAFMDLLNAMTDIPVPAGLGAGLRAPGFDPYLDFIRDQVFLKFSARGYKNAGEKWECSASSLEVLCKLLSQYEVQLEDFTDQMVELQGGGTVTANKSPGYTLLVHMLNDSGLLHMVLKILDDGIKQFEQYTSFPGKSSMERSTLLCLRMIEGTLEKEDAFVDLIRETGSGVMVSSADKMLLSINPRSGKADHLITIAKYIIYNNYLPQHALAATRILHLVCRSAPIQTELVNLFTLHEETSRNLLHGFVECLDVDDAETGAAESWQSGNTEEVMSPGQVRNATRQHLLQLLLHAVDQPGPNLAHYLLGFELRKPVSKTNLQDPGILGSPRTCLHAILALLDRGVGTKDGPLCLSDTPRLAELAYQLIYKLSANKDASAPTLRYLRTTYDFLFRQLQHLPLVPDNYNYPVLNHQSWLLKTVAIELRMTSLNRQRSHTQRLMKLLLDDYDEEQTSVMQPVGSEEPEYSTFDKFGEQSLLQSTTLSQSRALRGKQRKRRILSILDSLDFSQQYPPQLHLEFFDPRLIEQVISSTEKKTQQDVVYSDVKALYKILVNELNNLQGTTMAGQRPLILDEIDSILRTVVNRNTVREQLFAKRQAFDSWRQVTEVLLTSCPEDLLPGETRQSVLFEVLQDLLIQVADDESLSELTAPVSGVILTLMANLRQCFAIEDQLNPDQRAAHYITLLDSSGAGQPTSWGQSAGSKTLFATSLQIVLKGIIDYILRSSGSQQRVRANLYGALLYYLQITQKPAPLIVKGLDAGVGRKLLDTVDSELEQLTKENLSTILSYGDNFMDTVCRDACDGHDVGRMLALSVLDTILSLDKFQQWLSFLSSKGYLQHLVDSILTDDQQLQLLLGPSTEPLRALYIFESKMSLLTRAAASSAVGAHTLLRCGLMQRLASCAFLDMRPETDRQSHGLQGTMGDDTFIPNPLARYRHLLFSTLKLCLAILTSLGAENRDAGNQVMQFIVAHGEVFHTILRDRQPVLNLQALRELALTTAVIARANSQGDTETDVQEGDTAAIELRGHRARIQRQMVALLPRYALSEKLNKQLRNLESQEVHDGKDIKAEIALAYQEVAANVTAFCRSLVSISGPSVLYCRVLFGPNLEEAMARDLRSSEEFSISTLSPTQPPNLGVVVYQLKQCAQHFMAVYDDHQQHQRKLQGLSELSSEDLKEFSGISGNEKMSSQQRQMLARKRLTQIVHHKAQELQHYAYIIENCLFLLWRHLEYYLIHCVPTDQQPALYQTHVRRQQQMRRLQDLTGLTSGPTEDDDSVVSEYDNMTKGVTREELDTLRHAAVSAVSESTLKKLQEINQSYCKNRSQYGFVDALIRRIKRLLRLHTGS